MLTNGSILTGWTCREKKRAIWQNWRKQHVSPRKTVTSPQYRAKGAICTRPDAPAGTSSTAPAVPCCTRKVYRARYDSCISAGCTRRRACTGAQNAPKLAISPSQSCRSAPTCDGRPSPPQPSSTAGHSERADVWGICWRPRSPKEEGGRGRRGSCCGQAKMGFSFKKSEKKDFFRTKVTWQVSLSLHKNEISIMLLIKSTVHLSNM